MRRSCLRTTAPGEQISIVEGYDEQEEAQIVLREVGLLTRSKGASQAPYRLGEIAVMYRVNAQSRALEEACRRYGVSYQLIGGTKFYQRQEVKDVAAYLRLGSANPNDDVSLMRVVNLPPRGIGRRTLDELIRLARDQGTSAFEIDSQHLAFHGCRGSAGQRSVHGACRACPGRLQEAN